MLQKVGEAVKFLKSQCFDSPSTGIILGTGLGKFVNELDIIADIPYSRIPHFPVSTVEFHKGHLLFGRYRGINVVVMQGRMHLYEGYSMQEIAFPVRVLRHLGIKTLIVTNVGGALNLNFEKSSLVLITDHINLLGGSPLAGRYNDDFGPIFTDLSEPYSASLCDRARSIANSLGIQLHEGIYVAVPGPNLETRAEYRFLKMIGADIVGMSTIPEVIAACQMGLNVCGFSIITDICDPEKLEKVDIKEILKIAARGEKNLVKMICSLIKT